MSVSWKKWLMPLVRRKHNALEISYNNYKKWSNSVNDAKGEAEDSTAVILNIEKDFIAKKGGDLNS